MKFAFVVTNLAGGGAEKALLTLGSQLARRDHEVHLVLLEDHVDHVPPAGIRLHALTRRGRRLRKGVTLAEGDTLRLELRSGDRCTFVGYYQSATNLETEPWMRNEIISAFIEGECREGP